MYMYVCQLLCSNNRHHIEMLPIYIDGQDYSLYKKIKFSGDTHFSYLYICIGICFEKVLVNKEITCLYILIYPKDAT